jgi:formylglycine-generating enzyme required for sulfatase activity
MKRLIGRSLVWTLLWCQAAVAQEVDFVKEVQPILESSCVHCHNEDRSEGELRLDSLEAALAGGENGPALVPGKAKESPLYTLCVVPADDDSIMPPEDAPLSPWQTARLQAWIDQGAKWPEGLTLQVQPRIDFVKHIQPILEVNCVSCHSGEDPEAGYDISTQTLAFAGGDQGEAILPFQALESLTYTLTTLDKDDGELMPPSDKGGPLKAEEIEQLRLWIEQGAIWPEDLKLKVRARVITRKDTPDNLELVERLHAYILETAEKEAASATEDYTGKVPLTGVEFEMIAIPGGDFLMGSPASEADRNENEGPQVEVHVEPFWMGKHEVTWDEYEPFMITQVDRFKWGARMDYDPKVHTVVDAVSQPTAPYTEMSFGMGQKGFPAISMTQHAANKYCQWLSAQTGHFYRLATEAEWEYACRAGTTTAYSFGDDASRIGEYAWYYENANEKYQKVGKKKPNPWGLHDMHGNVLEWTADQFLPDYFEKIKEDTSSPFMRPDSRYPRSVRGGSWYDDAEDLRSAFRRGSDESWKMQDPQLPKSVWYHTNARWLGFRIVRPVKVPSVEEMYFYWNSAAD